MVEIDFFEDLSEKDKVLAMVQAKIEILIHEAENAPEWKATSALRCLAKEIEEELSSDRTL